MRWVVQVLVAVVLLIVVAPFLLFVLLALLASLLAPLILTAALAHMLILVAKVRGPEIATLVVAVPVSIAFVIIEIFARWQERKGPH